MKKSKFSQITLQTEEQLARRKAQRAIMARRLSLGITYQGMTPYPLTAVGTPEEVSQLRQEWGLE